MFDWIPFAAGIVILAWAFYAGLNAFRGGPHAGLHEVAPQPAAAADEDATIEETRSPVARFRVVQALQFAVAGAVGLAGLWLLIQTVD